jgi:hypothetical protein
MPLRFVDPLQPSCLGLTGDAATTSISPRYSHLLELFKVNAILTLVLLFSAAHMSTVPMASASTSSQGNPYSDIEKHAGAGLERTGDAIIDMGLDTKVSTGVNTASTRICYAHTQLFPH